MSYPGSTLLGVSGEKEVNDLIVPVLVLGYTSKQIVFCKNTGYSSDWIFKNYAKRSVTCSQYQKV